VKNHNRFHFVTTLLNKEIFEHFTIIDLLLLLVPLMESESSSSPAYLCPHSWGTGLPYGLNIRRTGQNPPRGPSAGWWVLTTANAAGVNRLTCLPKHGGAQDNKFLVTHPMND
jgi:hypothetical protein